MPTTTDHHPYVLAIQADCAGPDFDSCPGAYFLLGIQDSCNEYLRDYPDDITEDTAHEIADGAIPVYTHEMWTTFVDLAAYDEESDDPNPDLHGQARLALYAIAYRLASNLLAQED